MRVELKMAENNTGKESELYDNENFMNLVQNYRIIYDKKCKDYKDTRKKKNAWLELSKKVGVDVAEAQKRYNSIRTSFSKYLRKQRAAKVTGTGRNDLPEIKEEFEYLRWLITHIKHRSTTDNFESSIKRRKVEDDESEEERNEEQSEVCDENQSDTTNDQDTTCTSNGICSRESSHNDIDESTSTTSDNSTLDKVDTKEAEVPKPKPTKKAWTKSNRGPTNKEFDQEFLKTMHSIRNAIEPEMPKKSLQYDDDDDDRLFCLSLVSQLKKMDTKCKALAKVEIMKVFSNIEWMTSSPVPQPQFSERRGNTYVPPEYNVYRSPPFQSSWYQSLPDPGPTCKYPESRNIGQSVTPLNNGSPEPPMEGNY